MNDREMFNDAGLFIIDRAAWERLEQQEAAARASSEWCDLRDALFAEARQAVKGNLAALDHQPLQTVRDFLAARIAAASDLHADGARPTAQQITAHALGRLPRHKAARLRAIAAQHADRWPASWALDHAPDVPLSRTETGQERTFDPKG
jgi:hypothetical protein